MLKQALVTVVAAAIVVAVGICMALIFALGLVRAFLPVIALSIAIHYAFDVPYIEAFALSWIAAVVVNTLRKLK